MAVPNTYGLSVKWNGKRLLQETPGMSKTTTVICDGCNEEIKTTTGYESEAYLELSNVWKGHTGGAVFAMSLGGAINRDMQFHNLTCLRSYLAATPTPSKETKA